MIGRIICKYDQILKDDSSCNIGVEETHQAEKEELIINLRKLY